MKLLQTKHLKFSLLLLLTLSILSCQNADTENAGKDSDNSELAENDIKSDTIKSVKESEAPPKNKYELPDWPIKAKDEKGKVYPFDEGKKDASFVTFRQRLYQAVIEKDLDYLLSVIPDDINFSYGEQASKEGFLAAFGLKENPDESDFWKELAVCLELGGGFLDNLDSYSFYAPFVFMTNKLEDAYESGVIIGDNVRLREGPGSKEKILGSLSWDIVTVIYNDNSTKEVIDGESHYWMNIKTSTGEEGYVYGKYLRLPVDRRVGFVKKDTGEWIMQTFIAGD